MSIPLSPAQRRIVEAADGHYLVVAAAGSGKTRVLTERVRYLLEVRKIRSRVLALTFTNKAAGEMRDRLTDSVGTGDRAFIGTIHGFCQSVLEGHGKWVGFPSAPIILEREGDRIAMLETVFRDSPHLTHILLSQEGLDKPRKFLYALMETISRCKRDLDAFRKISSGEWSDEAEAIAFQEYQKHLASQGVIDFDDILLLAHSILTERPAVAELYQRMYPYICVDEAQDLNPVQYALIRTLGQGAKSVMLVGDPKQAIYGFNGSSAAFMLTEFPKAFQAQRIDLAENYRSSRAVIRAANSLYPGSMDGSGLVLEGECIVQPLPNEEEEAEWIATQIKNLLAKGTHPDIEGPISPEGIAVLARHRYVFDPLRLKLDASGIPYHLRMPGGAFSMESDIGRLFDLGIRLLVNPRNALYLSKLAKELGLPEPSGEPDLEGAALLAKVCADSDATKHPYLAHLNDAWKDLSLEVNRFRKSLERLRAFVSRAANETKADPEELASAKADLDLLESAWGAYTQKVPKDARSLGQFRNQLSMGEVLPNANGRGITLASVHAVKGTEFDIVFLIGLVEGCFPDYRAVRSNGAALAEEKNDAFVAVTRAKRLLFLTWPEFKFMPWDKERRAPQRKSRFLKAIEDGLALANHPAPLFGRVSEPTVTYPQKRDS